MEQAVLSFDKTRINYDISRVSGSFLVFIHGAGGDLSAWQRERNFFHRRGISTVAVDLRGHGKSGRPKSPRDYCIKSFARDIYCVLKKEKISNFIIVGHCFGGMVAMMFCKLYPQAAKSYVLIDTTYKAPKNLHRLFKNHLFVVNFMNHILMLERKSKKHLSHVKHSRFAGTGDYNIRRIFSDIIHTSLKSWLFTYENIARFNAIAIMKSLKKPVLIIEGEKDSIFDVLHAKKIHNLIRTSKLKIIPNENHIIVLNNPKVIEEEIFMFVKLVKGFMNVRDLKKFR